MRRTLLALTLVLSLAACQSSPAVLPSPEDAATPTQETKTAFTGTHTSIDLSQSSISFIGKSSIVDHPGSFASFAAMLKTDATARAEFARAALNVSIDLTSVSTDSKGLDGHLQREDFFDTANYPRATFASTSIESVGGMTYRILGDLTVKGVTKSITAMADVSDERIHATFDLPRKEFGVGNDSYGDKLLDPMVPVEVVLSLQ